ncbi:hypothetical protein ACFY2R_05245 [Micromonospora olivasterospora]|uniref:Conjugal transfer protein TraI n=1 Tax=Micromonospora olivasterospora TaxID=1880 RepID=A0A562I8F8_MICOL|nr:conjugal transfer protein TraI [Micromonospora olivasterospora]TWH67307.1 hypothetical protein JD77_02281 [Micromonospora olivasterospora]
MTVPTAPEPDETQRGIAELERYLSEVAPAKPERDGEPSSPGGETRRVRQLRAEVSEAHLLAELQDDDTPLMLDTRRVRRRRRAAYEAARLHELAQSPVMRAWQAARFRRLLVTAAMVSLALALAWSTAGVQAFAADSAAPWSPAWLFAWFVEPFMSLALLVVVGARAYMGTRGQPIKSQTLTRIERLFLALTLGMNAWPYLPWVADEFVFSRLVLHLLGPIVAVAVVTALPIILAAFAGLDHGGPTSLTGLTYRQNTPTGRADVAALVAQARQLIDAGTLPGEPSANALQRALHCGMDAARQVRDELRNR